MEYLQVFDKDRNVLEEKDINLEFANKINPIILTNKKSTDYTHIIMPLNS